MQFKDVPPLSLRFDSTHPNDSGYFYIAKKINDYRDVLLGSLITAPVDITVNSDSSKCSAVVNSGSPLTSVNCGVATMVSDHPSTVYPVGTTKVKWTVTDINGNSSSAIQNVTVIDKENPRIILRGITVNSDSSKCSAVVNTGTPVTSDNCGVATVVSDHSSTIYPVGTTKVKWTVTDVNGNSSTTIQTIIVLDKENPRITAPVNITVNSDSSKCSAVVINGTPLTSDNCGVATIVSDHSSTVYPVGTTKVKWTVTDVNGNSSSAIQNVSVLNREKPRITAPVDITVSSDSLKCLAVVNTGTPITSVNCGVATVVSDHSSIVYPVGTTKVKWTVTDINGNSSTATQTIKVIDKENPRIILRDITVNSDSSKCSAFVNTTPVTSDNCAVATVVSDHSSTVYPVGTTKVKWIVTDVNGNSNSAIQNVTVIDKENPRIILRDITVSSDSSKCSAVVNIGTPVTSDNCGVAKVVSDHSSTVYPVGTTKVKWSVIDVNGNSSTATQIIIVFDKENPRINAPVDITVNSDSLKCSAVVNTGTPVTLDNCGVATVVSDHPSTIYPVGTTKVKWKVTDVNGNSTTATQTIIVLDKENPSIILRDITVNSDSSKCSAVVNTGIPVTLDNCGVTTVISDHSSTIYPVGTTKVKWTVTDVNGNSSAATQTIMVLDKEKPSITAPVDITMSSDSSKCSAVVNTGTPVTSDNCGVAKVVSDHSSMLYPVGTTKVKWTVTDVNGNSSTATQTIIVVDMEYPLISVPTDIFVNNDSGKCGANINVGTPGVSDNCGVRATIGLRSDGLSLTDSYPVGTTSIVWTVTDVNNNINTGIQVIIVQDYEYPLISVPSDFTVSNDPGKCGAKVNVGTPTVSDNCGVRSTFGLRSDGLLLTDNYPVGTTTIVWTVIDIHDNTNTDTQVITVEDNEIPAITCPIDQTFNSDVTTYKLPPANTTDNCGVLQVSYTVIGATTRNGTGTDASGIFNLGESVVTWTVTDVNNNVNTCTIVITVNAPITLTKSLGKGSGPVKILKELSVKVSPNPSSSVFSLEVSSSDKITPASITVVEASGRPLEQFSKVSMGSVVKFGQRYAAGTYYAQVIQGGINKVIKVIKKL